MGSTLVLLNEQAPPSLTPEQLRALKPAERLYQYGEMVMCMPDVTAEDNFLNMSDMNGYKWSSVPHSVREQERLFVGRKTPWHHASNLSPDLICGIGHRSTGGAAIGLIKTDLHRTELQLPLDQLILDVYDEHFQS